jgi:RNA polymerase sigma factor (sigma-70 family)
MKKLDPPTHLEPEYLFDKYEPLRRAVYKKFKDKMMNNADREELWSTIGEIFLQLVSEFDPNRGVDFPYYIKRMLDLRTYHHITKYLKNVNRESYGEDFVVEDESYEELFNRIIDLHSIDPSIELGDKHRELMVGILIHKKTLKELAEEEGVPPDRLHARLYFLIKKLKEVHEQHKEKYGRDMY